MQSLVYHSAIIVSRLTGLSLVQALSLCIGVFLVIVSWPLGRLYALHYGRPARKA